MANLKMKRKRTLFLHTLRSGDSPLMILIFMEGVGDEIKSKQAYKRDRTLIYSRVQKNWNEVFFKILEEPSIVQKKMIPHIKGLDFSQR